MSILDKITGYLERGGAKESDGTPLSSIQSINDQTPDEIKLIAYIKEKISESRTSSSRQSLESNYLTNVAYQLGFSGISYDVSYRQFRNADPKTRLSKSQFKINKILPTIQNRSSRLTQTPPKWDVRPNSNSTDDKDAARLGLEIIENILDKQNFQEKRQDKTFSVQQGGVAYLQVTWDPCLGKTMVNPIDGSSYGYEGDIRIEVLNCLEVYHDPLAKRVDDCAWLIKAKVRKLEYFKERYPERGSLVKEEDAWLISSLYDLRSNNMTTAGVGPGGSGQQQMKNSAIELVYYEKRSKDYPNGRMIVTSNGVLLEDKELPCGEFDIVKFDDIPVGGRFNSEAIITHLRPIQDQYNIARTKCADWIKQTLAGKFIAPKGHGMSQEAVTNASGEVIEYNPVANASPPTAMQIPQIPPYVYKDLETLDKEFDFVSGLNEVSRGVLPSSSIPAAGMSFLQEQDQTRIAIQISRNEIGYSKIGALILKYVDKFYLMPRILKIAGDGLGYAVKEFTGKDIKENFDVIVIPSSTQTHSKLVKRQDIMNAYQAGLLGDPADTKLRAKVLKMMEYGDVNEMWKTQALDEGQIKRNIVKIENGDLPTYHELDNHSLYIQELNDYRKSDKYENLDDMKKSVFDVFLETHIQGEMRLRSPQTVENQMMADQMVSKMPEVFEQADQGQLPLAQTPPTPQPQMEQA